jgi:hypothetical protein
MGSRGKKPIPIEFEGVRYPSRKVLAYHIAATRGHSASTWMTRLSYFNGDVAQVLAGGQPKCDRTTA